MAAGSSVGSRGGKSGTGGGRAGAEVVTASSGAARFRTRIFLRSFSGLAVGRGGSAIRVGSGGTRVPVSSLGGGSGAGSVEGVVEDDGKLTMNVNGGGDLDGRRGSLRREALEMKDRLVLERELTMASSDAHKD